jgi:hypothetical protein
VKAGRKHRQDVPALPWAGVTAHDVRRYESIANALTPLVAPAPAPDEELSDRQWFVAVTNPNCEGRVIADMHERGILTVAPVIRYWRQHRRNRHVTERALMPGYVIFGLDRDRQHIVGVEGIERVIRNRAGEWDHLPARDVSLLRLRALTGEFDPTASGVSPFILWLVDHGELPLTAIIPLPEKRVERNRVSRVSRKSRWRKKKTS